MYIPKIMSISPAMMSGSASKKRLISMSLFSPASGRPKPGTVPVLELTVISMGFPESSADRGIMRKPDEGRLFLGRPPVPVKSRRSMESM